MTMRKKQQKSKFFIYNLILIDYYHPYFQPQNMKKTSINQNLPKITKINQCKCDLQFKYTILKIKISKYFCMNF